MTLLWVSRKVSVKKAGVPYSAVSTNVIQDATVNGIHRQMSLKQPDHVIKQTSIIETVSCFDPCYSDKSVTNQVRR